MTIEWVRGGRAIKTNDSSYLPRHVIAVSTLASPDNSLDHRNKVNHVFSCGFAVASRIVGTATTGRNGYALFSQDDFWRLLCIKSRAKQTVWIVGHNVLNDFVLLGMPDKFEQGELTVDWPRRKRKKTEKTGSLDPQSAMVVIDSPPTIIACRIGQTQGRVVFVDYCNWISATIPELLQSVNFANDKEPPAFCPVSKKVDYAGTVATAIHDAFLSLLQYTRKNDMGIFRYTCASQAMSLFRHRCMPVKIYPHDNVEVRKLERAGCFGGRSECFRLGEFRGTFYKLDVSSMFPSVMREFRLPYTLDRFELRDRYYADLPFTDFLDCIAEVTVDTKQGIYPYRTKTLNLYPTGMFSTVLCGPELQQAYLRGHIKGMRQWAKYKLDHVFAKYAETVWAMRDEAKENGNKVYSDYAKRLANSLHGKLSQLNPRWEFVENKQCGTAWSRWPEHDLQTNCTTEYRSVGYDVQKMVDRTEKSGTFIAIHAFITAYVRYKMNLLRGIAGGCEVYYQGVDSLIVTGIGYARLRNAGMLSEDEYGKLHLEGVADYCHIRGCADYTFGSKIVLAGRPGGCGEEEFSEMSLRQYTAREKLFAGKPLRSIEEIAGGFFKHGAYRKAIMQPDGWTTPIQLGCETCSSTVPTI